jgi:glycosyltransferase involved in cell wall biosynthesis
MCFTVTIIKGFGAEYPPQLLSQDLENGSMNDAINLLALGHDAGRQGAPKMMLEILTWLRDHENFEIETVLHMGGPLLPDFAAVARTTVLNPVLGSPRTTARILRRLVRPDVLDRVLARKLAVKLRGRPPDVVWANSVASWRSLDALTPPGLPRVLHVHELEYAIRRIGPPAGTLAGRADHFIAVSNAVRENLVHSHSVPADRVDVVWESVPGFSGRRSRADRRREERHKYAIGPDELVLIGCGEGSLRKGIDLVPPLLAELRSYDDLPRTRFVWVGRVEGDTRDVLLTDLDKLGAEDALCFAGEVEDPRELFPMGDAFVLLSREDPFPLVCLEAAQCGLPVVCFEGAGGAPEFVEEDAGRVVPYLDVAGVARAAAELALNPDLRTTLGRRAREKVEGRYRVEHQVTRLAEVLRNLVVQMR